MKHKVKVERIYLSKLYKVYSFFGNNFQRKKKIGELEDDENDTNN
jgi:hypothetical protein